VGMVCQIERATDAEANRFSRSKAVGLDWPPRAPARQLKPA
jgi:hypothetical protein